MKQTNIVIACYHINLNDNNLMLNENPLTKRNTTNFYPNCNKIKYGIIIAFYLRVLRMCSSRYLHDKKKYTENNFPNILSIYYITRRRKLATKQKEHK